ncbi:MAG: hypothetical protein K2X27_10665 [Candidatus Obscuribacterales bacterium]|nr:hypothetical protein [Candidatus Obscuribacterales bacterium]
MLVNNFETERIYIQRVSSNKATLLKGGKPMCHPNYAAAFRRAIKIAERAFMTAALLCTIQIAPSLAQETESNATTAAKPNRQPQAVAATATQSNSEIKQAALSIINLLNVLPAGMKKAMIVKVPSYNYIGVLGEMQARHAQFSLPGAEVRSTAKSIIQLESEQAGLRQTIYFN